MRELTAKEIDAVVGGKEIRREPKEIRREPKEIRR